MLLQRGIDLGNPVADHPINRGLMSWHLPLQNNSSGTRIFDLTGKNHGVSQGAKLGAKTPSGFATIRCNNNYVSLPDMGTVEAYPFSMGCWFKTGSSDNNMTLMGQHDAVGHVHRAQLYFANAGGYLYYNVRSTAEVEISNGITTYRDDKWHHAVGVSSASNSHIFYVDGKQVNSSSTTVTAPTVDSASIGSWGGSATYHFVGDITDARFYNRALSASEVFELYRQGLLGFPDLIRRTQRRFMLGSTAGGGGPVVPVFVHHYRQLGSM